MKLTLALKSHGCGRDEVDLKSHGCGRDAVPSVFPLHDCGRDGMKMITKT